MAMIGQSKSNTYGHKNKLILNISCFYAMFIFGLNYGMVSPILIELSSYINTPIESMGNFFSLVALGFITGSLASSILGRYRVRRKVFFSFYSLLPLSIVFIAFSFNYWLLLFSAFLMGIANGLLESNITVTLSEVNKGRESQYINYSQATISLGAFVGPLISTLSVRAGIHTRSVFLSIAFFSLLNLVLLFFIKVPESTSSSRINSSQLKKHISSRLGEPDSCFLRNVSIVLLLFVAMFFFVSSESGIGSWIPTYLRIEKGFSALLAGNLISFFWLAGGFGRLVTGYLSGKIKSSYILLFLCTLSAATIKISTILDNPAAITALLLFTGFIFSAIWPMIVSLGVHFFPKKSAVFLPLVIMAGGLGAIFSPWAIGLVYSRYDLQRGIDLIFVFSTVLLLLAIVLFYCDLKFFRKKRCPDS
jgi:fucose permease